MRPIGKEAKKPQNRMEEPAVPVRNEKNTRLECTNLHLLVEAVQNFSIKLDIKPIMHLLEISTLSLNNVIVRLTKIMNKAKKNWEHFY